MRTRVVSVVGLLSLGRAAAAWAGVPAGRAHELIRRSLAPATQLIRNERLAILGQLAPADNRQCHGILLTVTRPVEDQIEQKIIDAPFTLTLPPRDVEAAA